MDENHKNAGFRALVDSHKSETYYLEDHLGDHHLWSDLSPQGKLDAIAWEAADHGVSFEQFADVVRESIDKSALEDAALRMLLHSVSEVHEVEKLFPDDGRTESPPPLAERVAELLFDTEFSKTEYDRMAVEQRDDTSQRPLHEKGVRYEDEPVRLRDLLGDVVKKVEISKGIDEEGRDSIER